MRQSYFGRRNLITRRTDVKRPTLDAFQRRLERNCSYTTEWIEQKFAKKEMVKAANRWFDKLERRLDGREWIACADFTVADILLATVLREIRTTDLIDLYPRLKAYYARALARPAWQRTLNLNSDRLGVAVADIS